MKDGFQSFTSSYRHSVSFFFSACFQLALPACKWLLNFHLCPLCHILAKVLDQAVQIAVGFSFDKLWSKNVLLMKIWSSIIWLLATSYFKWSSLCLFSFNFNLESLILNRIVILISCTSSMIKSALFVFSSKALNVSSQDSHCDSYWISLRNLTVFHASLKEINDWFLPLLIFHICEDFTVQITLFESAGYCGFSTAFQKWVFNMQSIRNALEIFSIFR